MFTPQEESSSSSSSREPPAIIQETIPVKTDEDDHMELEDDMEDGSSQAGIGDDDRMLMSLMPDKTIPKRILQTWHDIEAKRKSGVGKTMLKECTGRYARKEQVTPQWKSSHNQESMEWQRD